MVSHSVFYGKHAQKTLEEIKSDAQRISRGIPFATKENDRHARENDCLASARNSRRAEQQTATSEVLGVIASSPTDLQPVLDVVVENAARLCDASNAVIQRVHGDCFQRVAHYGDVPETSPFGSHPLNRLTPSGRAILDRQTIHVNDISEHFDSEYPDARPLQKSYPTRTVLATPLLREGVPIGAILIRRREVRPFSEKQIALLKTFADQAVIAIENVRLFQELKESLEQQTATSEILGVIASSPTDIQPVLNAVAESAVRLCAAEDATIRLVYGNMLQQVAHHGTIPTAGAEQDRPINRQSVMGRAVVDRQLVHIEDLLPLAETEFLGAHVPGRDIRTMLAMPLLREGVAIGVIGLRRIEIRPFTDRQISLLKTFADQAAIAIENVRLFKELETRNRDLTEALEQQTATSKILEVIASSPTDLQPVMDAIAESAAQLCGANDALIFRLEGDSLKRFANFGSLPGELGGGPRGIDQNSIPGRAVIAREIIHIHDLAAVPETELPALFARRLGVRTALAAPLLRERSPIGVIMIRRTEVRPFSEKQIALLKTFADQAVIAIENVRLFKELQERNAELREALEHQTATAEVLGIISRSPTDVQPVLDAIVESAARVCGIDDVVLRLYEGNKAVARAHFGPIPIRTVEVSRDLPRFRWMREHGTFHVPDTRARNESPLVSSDIGWRTHLSVPLRQQEELIGHLSARRTEVRPFSPVQIKLLETFADQAVIALENVRLFQELKESLEQQTATSEILGVIASSPTDIQPVLDVVAENAARLCEADDALIRRLDGNVIRLVAHYGRIPPGGGPDPLVSRGSVPGRAIIDRQAIHVHDLTAEVNEFPETKLYQKHSGARTFLSMPMLREGTPIGVINIRRLEVRPFSEKHIALLKTFADQAVIAIENVRLFKELASATRSCARP